MLAQALRLYRISFLRCLPLAVLGALLAALAGAYASAQAHAVAGQVTALADTAVVAPEDALAIVSQIAAALRSLWHSPAVWASYGAALLIGLAFHGMLIARQAAIVDETTDAARPRARQLVPAHEWLSRALRCLPSLLGAVGLFAVVGVCAALLLAISSASVGSALLVGLGLLILGTWLWGRLQLWLVAMFTQQLSTVASLRESWNLVRGEWWRVSTLITVPYIAVGLVSSLADVLAIARPASAATGSALLGQVVIVASSALTLPMLPAAWLAIYRDLSARRNREAARARSTPRTPLRG
jgi:hypothetical protein